MLIYFIAQPVDWSWTELFDWNASWMIDMLTESITKNSKQKWEFLAKLLENILSKEMKKINDCGKCLLYVQKTELEQSFFQTIPPLHWPNQCQFLTNLLIYCQLKTIKHLHR